LNEQAPPGQAAGWVQLSNLQPPSRHKWSQETVNDTATEQKASKYTAAEIIAVRMESIAYRSGSTSMRRTDAYVK
jgi:hypothetical protein